MIRACKLHFNAWNDTWIPFNRFIPLLYQFGTSGNEIGKAKTQFGKHKTVFAKLSFNFVNFTSACAKLILKMYKFNILKEDRIFRQKSLLFWKRIFPHHGMSCHANFATKDSVSCIPKPYKWTQVINENSSNWMIKADIIKMNPVSWILRTRSRLISSFHKRH